MSEKDRIAEKVKRSEKISDLTIYISFGLIAVTFTLFSSSSEFAKELLSNHEKLFLIASLCGFMSVFSHYLQYVFGYQATSKALKSDDYMYDRNWWSHKIIKPLFFIKQLLAIAGVVFVGFAMLQTILGCSG
ncbi:hypothetical protein [Vibrio navarrensis]|uniref:hypothetical protein n=1 Tax=Vibrio navarrensis TaxID=29495 RepID=UPI0018698AB5|nr:hypothetical protein [Vibrio navarrensis]EJK2116998.1 hypothetical protein [Vibrio navarrensis]MBE4590673.1 hypothetical protein [Vibrio navarrensis]